ncbi:unnamed protein product [Sphagnum jensenii]
MKGRKAQVESGAHIRKDREGCCCIPVPHHAFLLTADDLSLNVCGSTGYRSDWIGEGEGEGVAIVAGKDR